MEHRFDIALSRSPSVVIGWLGLLNLGLIVVTAIVVTVFRLTGVNGGERLGILASSVYAVDFHARSGILAYFPNSRAGPTPSVSCASSDARCSAC